MSKQPITIRCPVTLPELGEAMTVLGREVSVEVDARSNGKILSVTYEPGGPFSAVSEFILLVWVWKFLQFEGCEKSELLVTVISMLAAADRREVINHLLDAYWDFLVKGEERSFMAFRASRITLSRELAS